MKKTNAVLMGAAAAGAGLLCAGAAASAVAAGFGRKAKAKLRGQAVLVTGSSRGLGLALAEEFGRRGARLILTARDPEELNRARTMLIRRGAVADGDVAVVPADLRRAEDAEDLIRRATHLFGRVDILVNNAGVITVGPVENQTSEDFHQVMDTNFFSHLHCTLAVLPQMLARRNGTIVNIASVGGKVAVPHLLPYTASKFAVVGFSEGLHAELQAKGIHVLTVCPGLMRTGSHLNALFSGDAEREYQWFSLGATLPGFATTAAHAARRIVTAVLRHETEIAITPYAVLAARLGQLSPALTAGIAGLANRLLPPPSAGGAKTQRGAAVRGKELPPVKYLGEGAAQRYNQTA